MNANRSPDDHGSSRKDFVEGELSREIVGAFFEVYNALGPGFVEKIYSGALEIALRERGLLVEREFPVKVFFHNREVGVHRIDIFVERRVVIELKADRKVVEAHFSQLRSCVNAANVRLGILLHFGAHATFQRVLGRKTAG